jgi:hypothetical protein
MAETIKCKYIAVPNTKMFMLSDIGFWAEHEQGLDEWCAKNFCVRKGMTVTALNEYGYLLFGLRWS